MKIIAIEDLITLVCSEFVSMNKEYLQYRWNSSVNGNELLRIPYLKMNFKQRRRLSEKLIDKMDQDYLKKEK
jgi:hypothetical protein